MTVYYNICGTLFHDSLILVIEAIPVFHIKQCNTTNDMKSSNNFISIIPKLLSTSQKYSLITIPAALHSVTTELTLPSFDGTSPFITACLQCTEVKVTSTPNLSPISVPRNSTLESRQKSYCDE
ncbi:hypothetical protein R5R35_009743 [Gryllus longicercus]|uniref:Uncharacterized protein n=1 Tax=Gryllus longicercus TaxID=2509291 RepID=A0AAN9V4E2_9ORTH